MSNRLDREYLEKLNDLDTGNRVALCWIPKHSGIDSNEKAILLPKKIATSSFVRSEPFCEES